MTEPLLSVSLSAHYNSREALKSVSLDVARGEIVGLVGQSGCGKSTLALSILRLLERKGGTAAGNIFFNGRDLMTLKESELRQIRGREVALVLQSPISSLNPALKIGTQLAEAWKVHRRGTRQECRAALLQSLENVSLPADESFLQRRPNQLSVGQAQRVLIAMAVLHRPALLIADEATSALDVVTQAEILALFRKLNREMGMSILYISHDLLSVATICHRISVMKDGEIVECNSAQNVFLHPQHPYTKTLVASLPVPPFSTAHPSEPAQLLAKSQVATRG
ncbi:MAG TPA: ABC transporter ATP-binding protein [Terriglobales bacterium]|nr:ABC transporter ATP-binding protein [Terriglobales bacterium]